MSQPAKRGLGRGFESLLPKSFDKTLLLSPDDRIEKVPIDNIKPNPNQPRKHFDESSIDELASSIKRYGIIQPLLVTPGKDGSYLIVAGERRWRAAKNAKLSHVPAVIHKRKELDQIEVALTENVQRVDLNAIEQAITFEKLHQQFNVAYSDIADRLGKGKSTITNIVRLLKLPDNAKDALIEGKITEGHARQIVATDDLEQQNYLLRAIIQYGWNVRQAEQYITSLKSGINEAEKASARTSAETPQTQALSEKLNTTVTLKRMAHGGRLEITYKNDSDLNRIIERIN